jgi:hypothetical protein
VPRWLFLLILPALAAGCGKDSKPAPTKPQAALDAAADFHLLDVNPASPRHDDKVSPRDYLDRISAWYFGHST